MPRSRLLFAAARPCEMMMMGSPRDFWSIISYHIISPLFVQRAFFNPLPSKRYIPCRSFHCFVSMYISARGEQAFFLYCIVLAHIEQTRVCSKKFGLARIVFIICCLFVVFFFTKCICGSGTLWDAYIFVYVYVCL